jgi:hypothetical protein
MLLNPVRSYKNVIRHIKKLTLKNMKNNVLKISLFAFGTLVCIFGCNQANNPNDKNSQTETTKDEFKLNSPKDTTKFETLYNDGRISGVRNSKYYYYLVKDGIPMKDAKQGLTTVITEWNKYDANVACPEAAFIQTELLMESEQKKELIAAGADANSTMVGGDEETNRRIKEPSKRYWAVASKMFEQEFSSLKKAEGISNRDTNYVTFDFITTKGFYTVQVEKTKLESDQSIWSNLFKESKFLNTEMARVQNESAIDAEKRYKDRQLKKLKK